MRVYVHARMLSRFSCVRLFLTLWTVAHQAPLSVGFFRQKYWSRLLCPPPGNLPNPGIKSKSPALQVDFYHLNPQGSPGRQICYNKLIENKESYLRYTFFWNSYSATYIKFRETSIDCLYLLKILMLKSNLH